MKLFTDTHIFSNFFVCSIWITITARTSEAFFVPFEQYFTQKYIFLISRNILVTEKFANFHTEEGAGNNVRHFFYIFLFWPKRLVSRKKWRKIPKFSHCGRGGPWRAENGVHLYSVVLFRSESMKKRFITNVALKINK